MAQCDFTGGVGKESSALPSLPPRDEALGRGWGGGRAGSGLGYGRGGLWQRGKIGGERGSFSPPPLHPIALSLSLSFSHSAVASQLVPRGTWRHLVSVSTGATVEGCGRLSSAPVAAEEAADARLQGVTGGGEHSFRGATVEGSVEEMSMGAVVL